MLGLFLTGVFQLCEQCVSMLVLLSNAAHHSSGLGYVVCRRALSGSYSKATPQVGFHLACSFANPFLAYDRSFNSWPLRSFTIRMSATTQTHTHTHAHEQIHTTIHTHTVTNTYLISCQRYGLLYERLHSSHMHRQSELIRFRSTNKTGRLVLSSRR